MSIRTRAAYLSAILLAAPALAGAPVIVVPPTGPIQIGPPVLDQRCVDRIKGHGGSDALAVHECRKPREPGTAPAPGLRKNADSPAH